MAGCDAAEEERAVSQRRKKPIRPAGPARGAGEGEAAPPGRNPPRRAEPTARALPGVSLGSPELDLIVDSALDAVIVLDAGLRVIRCNPVAEKMYGWPAGGLTGQPLDALVPPDCRALTRRDVLGASRSQGAKKPLPDGPPRLARRSDGTSFLVESSIVSTRVGGRDTYLAFIRDVSERTRVMESLIESEQTLRDFFSSAPIGFMWVSRDGLVARVNDALLQIIGRQSRDVLDRPLTWICSATQDAGGLQAAVIKGETVLNRRCQVTLPDGTRRHVLVDANAWVRRGRFVHARWFVRDITRRVELEGEVLRAAEQERERIGHELHDDICQQLTALEYQSEILVRDVPPARRKLAAEIQQISAGLRRANAHIREIAHGLSPTGLPNPDGLASLLAQLADRTQRVFRRRCRFSCASPVGAVPPSTSIQLYRIAQEAVANAIKHGRASRIEIVLTPSAHELILTVEDNGSGIRDQPRRTDGLGLRIMQYRAGTMNGSIAVQRSPTGGVKVTCTVPVIPPCGVSP